MNSDQISTTDKNSSTLSEVTMHTSQSETGLSVATQSVAGVPAKSQSAPDLPTSDNELDCDIEKGSPLDE